MRCRQHASGMSAGALLAMALIAGCGADPRATALCKAIGRHDVAEAVRLLGETPVDLTADEGGCVPARDAFLQAGTPEGLRVALALLDHGLKPDSAVLLQGRHRGPNQTSVRSLVELAAGQQSPELVRALLRKGLDARQPAAGLAVLRAAEAGHLETLRTLVEAGAHVDTPLGNSTALGRAIRHRHHEIIRFLDARGARESVDEGSGIFRAARLGDLESVRAALAQGAVPDALDAEGETALVRAAAFGQRPVLEALIAAGASLDFMVDEGRAALHVAVSEGQGEIARMLLRAGAKADARYDEHSPTPLMLALQRRDEALVAILVEAGADATLLSGAGDSPLRAAVQNRDLPMARALLRGKGDVNRRPDTGLPILHLATSGCDAADFDLPLIQALLDAGAKPEDVDGEGHSAGTRAQRLALEESRPFYKACHEARARLLTGGR